MYILLVCSSRVDPLETEDVKVTDDRNVGSKKYIFKVNAKMLFPGNKKMPRRLFTTGQP